MVYLMLGTPAGPPLFLEFSTRDNAVKAITALKANGVNPPVILVLDK